MVYRYYSTQRPLTPGSCPRAGVQEVVNYDEKKFCEEIGMDAWGFVEYTRELTKQDTDCRYYFIMGADSLYQIETWKDPGQIFTMADILVATRNDSRSALDAQIDYLEEKYDGKIYHLSSPSIEISSNDIRKRCSNGSSIHFFLPEDVIDYIERNDLYGSTADRRKA